MLIDVYMPLNGVPTNKVAIVSLHELIIWHRMFLPPGMAVSF